MALFSRQSLTDFTLKNLGMVADRITTAIERQIVTNAHQKLAELNERILTSAGEGIYGVDLEGVITFANPAGAKLLGYEVEELIGMSIHAVTSTPKEESLTNVSLRDGVMHHVDNEVLWKKDGTSFPVEYTSTPIWEDEQLCGAVVTVQDITERKRAQEAHHKICQQMEKTLASSARVDFCRGTQSTDRVLEP